MIIVIVYCTYVRMLYVSYYVHILLTFPYSEKFWLGEIVITKHWRGKLWLFYNLSYSRKLWQIRMSSM